MHTNKQCVIFSSKGRGVATYKQQLITSLMVQPRNTLARILQLMVGARIAVLTSGEDGDSPGVNAAIRAVIKTAVNNNIEPFVVFDGFAGLHDGNIKQVAKTFVSGILEKVCRCNYQHLNPHLGQGGYIFGFISAEPKVLHSRRNKKGCIQSNYKKDK